MRTTFGILSLVLFLLSCGNKDKREYTPAVTDSVGQECYQQPDTAPTSPTLSPPSHSHKSSGYDRSATREDASQSNNMRGFDPASEDDMDDNGMSRYMENNDEEGWD